MRLCAMAAFASATMFACRTAPRPAPPPPVLPPPALPARAEPEAPVPAPHRQPDLLLEYGSPLDTRCTGPHVMFEGGETCRCSGHHKRPNGAFDDRAGTRCAFEFYDRSLAGVVTARLDAPATVTPGATTELRIIVTNTSAEMLPLVLGNSRGTAVEIHDAHDRDVTFVGDCRQGFSASGTDFLVGVEPGGVVELPITWVAERTDLCNHKRIPLAAGRYRLIVRTTPVRELPKLFEVIDTTIEVK